MKGNDTYSHSLLHKANKVKNGVTVGINNNYTSW